MRQLPAYWWRGRLACVIAEADEQSNDFLIVVPKDILLLQIYTNL